MRVLQISKWYLPYTGGIETVVQQIAQGMGARGASMKVLACHHQRHLRDTRECVGGVDVVRAGSFGNALSTPLSPSFFKHYRRQVQWADVVHFHAPFPLAELVHGWTDLSDKRVVVTFHADPSRTRWGFLAALYRPVLRRLLRSAHRVVVTSPQMRDAARTLQGLEQKCEVIPLGASLAEPRGAAAPDRQVAKRALGLASQPVVLTVGRLVYYKGFPYLIEAMQQIDAMLIIVGKGKELKALKRRAEALQVAHKVRFAGYVSDEALAQYYAAADVFVLPSVTPAEAFGIVQVEAMARGVPVVNTTLPTGVPFVSLHGETGLTVAPRDANALAQATNTLLRKDALRKKMSENACRRAQQFSAAAMVDRYDVLYKALMKEA